jgi:hypothetical protein
MKYLELLWALDILSRYYPRYHTHDLIILADDIWKWMNNELPENSSTLIYLKSCFSSPTEAFKAVWSEIQLLSGPFMHLN